jgi:hypothetical protein
MYLRIVILHFAVFLQLGLAEQLIPLPLTGDTTAYLIHFVNRQPSSFRVDETPMPNGARIVSISFQDIRPEEITEEVINGSNPPLIRPTSNDAITNAEIQIGPLDLYRIFWTDGTFRIQVANAGVLPSKTASLLSKPLPNNQPPTRTIGWNSRWLLAGGVAILAGSSALLFGLLPDNGKEKPIDPLVLDFPK